MRGMRTLLSAAAILFAATLFPIHTALAAPTADLSVKVSGSPDPVVRDWIVTWTITVTNHGPRDATNVAVQANYGSDASASSAETTQGSCQLNGGVVAFALGTVQSGATAVATAVLIDFGGDGGAIGVDVTATTTDPNPGNNHASGLVTTIDGPTPPSAWPNGPFCAPEGGVAAGMGGTAAGSSSAPLMFLLILGLAGITAGAVRLARR